MADVTTVLTAESRGRDPVTVVVLTGSRACDVARGLIAELTDVAVSAFGEPPWNESPVQAGQLTGRLLADAEQAGFALAFAFCGTGPGVAGFAYGLRRRPAARYGIPDAGDGPPFELCELAVRSAARGRGTGRRLHDAVLDVSGPGPRWLVTHPAAVPAVTLYQTAGWRSHGLVSGAADGIPRMVMTQDR